MLNRSDSLEGMTKGANREEAVHVIIIAPAGTQAFLFLPLKSTLT